MAYLNAFVMGGVICMLCQLLLIYSKLGVPKILILAFTIGALLAATGVMPKLVGWGGAGVLIMIVGAGDAVFTGTLLALAGNYQLMAAFLGIIGAVTLIGIVGALAYLKINAGHRDAVTPKITI